MSWSLKFIKIENFISKEAKSSISSTFMNGPKQATVRPKHAAQLNPFLNVFNMYIVTRSHMGVESNFEVESDRLNGLSLRDH